MKKILFMILLIWGINNISDGQNRSIQFEKGTWKEVLGKAKKRNKLVFLDCHTSWCVPCKKLAAEVFTNDTVADYYNSHFISMQMDMEKGEGKGLMKVFEIRAYPTLLYLDGEGNIQHRAVGYCTPEELIGIGKRALDSKHNYTALVKRYETGDREVSFVREYLTVLAKGKEEEKLVKVTQEYLEGLDDASFYTEETWQYIYNGVTDFFSPSFQRLINGLEKFYPLVGQEVVDQKVDWVLSDAVSNITKLSSWKEEEFQYLLTFLKGSPFDGCSRYLTQMYISKCIHDENYAEMLEHINFVLDYNILKGGNVLRYALYCIPSLGKAKEPEAMKKAIILIDRLMPLMRHPVQEGRLLEQKVILLENMGETEQAESVRAAIKVAEEKGERIMKERMKSNEE